MIAENSTPTLEAVIKQAVDFALYELHTDMPGKVDSYDSAKGLATILPSLMKNGEPLPKLPNVPICFPFNFTFPIQSGDEGLLLFSERSIDNWKVVGGIVDPRDPRHHNLSDAVFIPFKRNNGTDNTAVTIQNGNSNIKIFTSGEIKITNGNIFIDLNSSGKIKISNGTYDLIAELATLVQNISLITTSPSGGKILNAKDFVSLLTIFQGFQQ